MSAANWHLPSVSTRTKSCAVAAADFQHPLKVQGAQKWDALCWCRGYWGHWQNRSSDMSGADFISPIVSPHMEKSTKILHSDNCWSWLAESFMRLAETWKNVPDCVYSPFTRIIYTVLSPHNLWSSFSELSEVLLKSTIPYSLQQQVFLRRQNDLKLTWNCKGPKGAR